MPAVSTGAAGAEPAPPGGPVQHHGRGLKYRPDIDGLRALAVLPVLTYHYRFSQTPGGYIGVDVFFVISGYLISSILFSEIAGERYRITRFYERRVRRIAPALLVMMAVSCIVAVLTLPPAELALFGRSMLAATLSVSNFFFRLESSYFDDAVRTIPLVHTWSLAVEEQFYLVFPLLLLAIRRLSRRSVVAVVGAVWLASFAGCVLLTARDPAAAFYTTPTRVWELMTGSLLALGAAPRLRDRWLGNGVALAGLAAIVAPVFLYTERTPFPGVAALAPCLGAAAIIAAGRERTTLVGRALSLRPLVFIGLISYSLYLWHWPLYVFDKATLFFALTPKVEKLVLLALSFVLAGLSWRLVEEPFRGRQVRFRPLGIGVAVTAAALAAVGLGLVAARGLPGRYSAEELRLASYLGYDARAMLRAGGCFSTAPGEFHPATCLAEDPAKPTYLLLGDSHAADLAPGLAEALPGANVQQATGASCRPLLAVRSSPLRHCSELMGEMFDRHLRRARPERIILSANWNGDALEPLFETVRALRRSGQSVLVVGPAVAYDNAAPRLLLLARRRHDQGLPARHLYRALFGFDRAMAARAAKEGVPYLSLLDALCGRAGCVEWAQGAPLLYDTDHFTREGSRYVAPLIVRALREADSRERPARR
jgi:peptidoglycan/LPS O-acetylase OafA/YrhL